jgi:Ni/Fe-hydrogenase subunit HybB-like protein
MSTSATGTGPDRSALAAVTAEPLLGPMLITGRAYRRMTLLMGAVIAWGAFCFLYQSFIGLGVTGLRRPVFWGFFITDFVFWIGISHAGTLISAILRLTNAGWRFAVTRAAEAITVFALMIGGMFPIVHLGRPWLFYWLAPYPNARMIWPNFRSPLEWDFFAVSTYLIGSSLYLYLPLIPDLALARDRTRGLRHRFYRFAAMSWRGTQTQWHRLELAIQLMAAVVIAIAVSVHTIVSWDFAMAVVPSWHSTIFGPYFVAGAIFSGIAALILIMAILRRLYHLEAYLQPKHFANLGKLLLLMTLLWGYFVFAEMLTTWYGNLPADMPTFWGKVSGHYAFLFWLMVTCNFIIPFPLLAIKRLRTIPGMVAASITVLIGMWLERFLIVVPGGAYQRLDFNSWLHYVPSWTEISISAATVTSMALLYMIFSKLFPIISIWEVGAHGSPAATDAPLAPGTGGASR